MMNNTINILTCTVLFLLTIASYSCSNKSNDNKLIIQNKTQIEKNKHITYAVHVNAKTPYELYLDDILIDRFYENNMNRSTDLNTYLLNNGTHKLKIRYLPLSDSQDGLLDPKDIIFNKDSRWHIYFVSLNKDPEAPLGYTNEIDYGSSALNIITPPKKVPFWEQEWDLEIKDLPYKLKGWSESEDLSKVNQDELKKEVVAFFEEQRLLLNEGKVDEYLQLGLKKDQELIVATYGEDLEYYNSQERKKNILRAKGDMLPLENYTLELFANGRLATLIIASGQYKNWSALLSKSEKGRVSGWGILVHKPKGSSQFEIIRK
ncbi:hypothetical protein IC610_11805 [Chryseobacterium sp. GCR10]|uniref:Uncharacterized protein n=2 Tax=Chryseobacterium caseinilyticum TaxID=2771428 RepID=A0ABR8ZE19_9FLAO|nr:hypothetical protein [Chryseobacterium caseinilyticum]